MRTGVTQRGMARVLIFTGLLSFAPPVALASPPTATIVSPVAGMVETKGTSVFFEGSGNDPEDGVLKGSSLVWASDQEGPIGTGEYFGTKLGSGTHLITLTVTDSNGETVTAQVSITIVE